MNLNDWQERISAHFAQLRDQRIGKAQSRTLYALEHGLDQDELDDLKHQIHSFLNNSRPSDRHYMAWVVYSAEIGYRYSGEEYWDTFSELTPNWEDGCRDYIRDAYRQFHDVFGGTKPRGRWAEHFKIICWPITHAILPRDLQNELAQVLYELRGAFDSDVLRDPEALGKEVRDAAWNGGARFRKFTEDQLLVGQISAALLLSDDETQNARVLPNTLKRISKDLDQNRRSREWLRHARQRAHLVTIRGLAKETAFPQDTGSSLNPSRLTPRDREAIELGLEPDLNLVRTARNSWSVRLKADLTRFIRRYPELRETVANQRCTVAGSEPRIFPKGYFLFGNQEVTLSRWPASDELLLKFEQPQPQLEYLLTAECLLRPGPIWLFKLSSDGTARQVRTGAIRPGSSYILLSRSVESLPSALAVEKLALNCEGINAVQLNVPGVVSKAYVEELNDIHLQLNSGLELLPLGIPAAKWDGNGTAEWLSTDPPLIRISADFEVDGILLNLVGPSPSKLEIREPVWPLLLDLGQLQTGVHELHVVFSRPGSEVLLRSFLRFTTRQARIWNGDKPAATPFVVQASPAAPSLEELWGGQVSFELLGPSKEKAEAEIKFIARGAVVLERKFGPLGIPCSATNWSEFWDKLTSDKDCQNAFDASTECELAIRCDFGQYLMRAVRESRPLRWIVKQENSGYSLRSEQLDDRAFVTYSRYPFRTPLEMHPVKENSISGFRVPEEGGLFVASTTEETASVIVPPAIHSLKWLAAEVVLPALERSDTGVCQLVRSLEVWHRARAIGNRFATKRKHAVERALNEEAIRLFCGDEWLKYERLYGSNRISIEGFASFVWRGTQYGRIGSELLLRRRQLGSGTIAENSGLIYRLYSERFALPPFSTSTKDGAGSQRWAIEFAHRALMDPHSVRSWAQQEFVPAIRYLLENSVICRVVRFAVLLSELNDHNQQNLELVEP